MPNNQKSEAVVDLFVRYYKIIYNHCLIMANYDRRFIASIDDCIQEAFVTYLLSYETLASHPNPVGWLCRAAWNRLRTEIRNTVGRDQKLRQMAVLEEALPSAVEAALERWASREDAAAQIAAIYEILTTKERAIYQSYFLDGLSKAEAAKATGMTEDAAHSAIRRIRNRARQYENFLLILLLLATLSHFSRTI